MTGPSDSTGKGGAKRGKGFVGGDWGNDSLPMESIKKPAFTPKSMGEPKPQEKQETPKVETKFNFIESKVIKQKEEEKKKKDEIPLELLEIIDSDVLSSDAYMYHAKIVFELIQLGGIKLKPAQSLFDKFGKEASSLEFNIIASMLFNSAVDDSIPCISRLRAVYAIDYLAELNKNYYTFFKANYDNLDFFDVASMKEENASAGAELEKTVNHVKEVLNRPFGETQKEVAFDPLNLQKDIPDKKKPDGLNFLSKGKAQPKGNDDLLGLDLNESPEPASNTNNGQQKTSKPNALNFLNKKTEPKPAAQTTNLLDLDLIGGMTTPVTTLPKSTHQNGGGVNLFDLQVQSTPTQTNISSTFSTPMNTKKEEFGDLLDLEAFTPTTHVQPPAQKKPPSKIEDMFDFGL